MSEGAFIFLMFIAVLGTIIVIALILGLLLAWAAREDWLLEREAEQIVQEEVRELERVLNLPARTPVGHR